MAPAGEQVFSANPLAPALSRVVYAPLQFTTDDDDNLQIVSANSVAGVQLTLQGRRVNEFGAIVPFSFQHTPNTDRSTKTQNFQFGRGGLLNLTLFASSGSPLSGQTYAMVRLIKGLSGATIVLGTLLAGYVTSVQALGWPGSPIVASTQGQPAVRFITGTTPAVGVDFSETVPTGARWELLTVWSALQTSGAAGNRDAWMQWVSGAQQFWTSLPSFTQTAGTQFVYIWQQFNQLTSSSSTAHVTQPLPPVNVLLAGQKFASVTTTILAGDQWLAPVYTVREWLEVN